MHADPITQAAVAGQPAAPPAPAVGPAEAVQQLRQAALEEQQTALQARRDAQQASQDAQQAAQDAAQQAGRTFRIEKDGKVVTVGPDGVIVTNSETGVPAPPSPVPPEAVGISIAFFLTVLLIAIGWPIARAIARRMDRATVAPAQGGADNAAQLRRIEQAVEAMAIEVERVSENQRFVTKLLSEGRPDGALLAASNARGSAERATPESPPSR